MKFIWKELSGKTSLMFGCIALLGLLGFIDGILQGDILKLLVGGIVVWCAGMFRGFPWYAALFGFGAFAALGSAWKRASE